jgi:hypothetical protein
MRIAIPRIAEENGELCVSAGVRVDTPGLDMPGSLWFRFPASYRGYLNERSDAFAVAMLPVAMLLGEDLVVEGDVSIRLARGMREYQTAFHQWWPRLLSVVDVHYGALSPGRGERTAAVGCTCSGGVDSFYSIFRHLPRNEPLAELRITHGLIVNGFNWDVELEETRNFGRAVETLEPILQRNGIDLLVARQNTQAFLEATGKVTQSSAVLEVGVVSAALMLGGLLRRFYLPGGGSYRYADNPPHGFHPSALPLLTSDDTDIYLDGLDATRTEKTLVISGWEDTYRALRVCWRPTAYNEETGLIENCCECPKCLRTMLTLEMAGKLSKYATFPRPLDRGRVRRSQFVSAHEKLFYFDLQRFARETGRADLARDLRRARFASRVRAAIRHRILRRPAPRH